MSTPPFKSPLSFVPSDVYLRMMPKVRILKIAFFVSLAIAATSFALIYNSLNLNYQWKEKENILLEGWIGAPTLEKLALHLQQNSVDSILLLGWEYNLEDNNLEEIKEGDNSKTIKLIANSSLVIKPDKVDIQDTISEIEILLKGDSATSYFAHYSIFINQKLAESGFAKHKVRRLYKLNGVDLETITITFDNDTRTANADRNLEIISVNHNGEVLTPANANLYIHRSNFHKVGQYASNAAFVKQYCHDLGLDTSTFKTSVIELQENGKTIALARHFSSLLIHNKNLQKHAFYIFGESNHALRSLIAFRRASQNPKNIGVYVHPSNDNLKSDENILYKIEEVLNIIYLLLFFHV